MICSRCETNPAICDVMILSIKLGYPRVVLCAQCNREMTYEEAGNAHRRLLTVFDGPAVVLSRTQTRRIRFLLYLTWENDEDPANDLDLYVEPDFELPENVDELIAAELARVESPVELHYCTMNYNWDSGEEALRPVLDHPLCDEGTALVI